MPADKILVPLKIQVNSEEMLQFFPKFRKVTTAYYGHLFLVLFNITNPKIFYLSFKSNVPLQT